MAAAIAFSVFVSPLSADDAVENSESPPATTVWYGGIGNLNSDGLSWTVAHAEL